MGSMNTPVGSNVGVSSCNSQTTALGSGQKVLSFSFYSPNRPFRLGTGGRKIAESSKKYYSLIGTIVGTARTMYPGWRVRIYRNVTRGNEEVWGKFCQYFCTEDILDLCDVNSLPGMDKWNSEKPHGMFWRMQPLGDPTVLKFQSRDL